MTVKSTRDDEQINPTRTFTFTLALTCRSHGFRTSLTKPATDAKVPWTTKLQSKGQSCCGGVRTCAASSNHSLTLNARHSMVSAPRRTPARFLHNAE